MARTALTNSDLELWFTRRIPRDWFTSIELLSDPEEILIVGTIEEPPAEADETEGLKEARLAGAIGAFREATRGERIAIARAAESTFRRRVSWGVVCGGLRRLFTTNTVPVMTRLRLPERQVLDTLIDAGVVRSRSEAVAWCIQRVADRESDWLAQLRAAFVHVASVRAAGPDLA
ncbi:MAG TPA: hypothetical protein VHF25_11750 [Nitriliruptorales bacterium]|nr:hypothetical protein [Nitriliruptorales bacterium]